MSKYAFISIVFMSMTAININANPCLPESQVTQISEIQGSGKSSPYSGQKVVIQGRVIANMQDRSKIRGIYVSEHSERTDLLSNTSDAIFVYLPANHSLKSKKFPLTVGQSIQVSGQVKEHYGLTELAQVDQVLLCNSDIKRPKIKNLKHLDIKTLESSESMLINISQAWVSGNSDLSQYGELQLSSQNPIKTDKTSESGALVLTLGEKPSIQPLLTQPEIARLGTKLKPVTGVLHFAYGKYWLIPTTPIQAERTFRPQPPDVPDNTLLSLSHLNLKNLFNGNGKGSEFPTSRGAKSYKDYQFQLAKIALSLHEMNTHIIAVSEIENDGYGPQSTIADLVDAINKNRKSNFYQYATPSQENNLQSSDVITQGFLFQPKFIDVSNMNFLSLQSSDYPARPALLVKGAIKSSGQIFQVAIVHLKSRGRPCKNDSSTNEGNCHQRREAQIKMLLDQMRPGDGIDLIVGDFNAYPNEKPFALARQKGWIRTGELEHRINGIPNDIDFTYVFKNQPLILDHILLHQDDQSAFLKRIDWHINAAETPEIIKQEQASGTMTRYRSSDHDPNIIYLK